MKHSHDDDRLTFGCHECRARVNADQFWSRVYEESLVREDDEFGIPGSMMLHLIEYEWEDEADEHMRFIPNWMLRSLLDECRQADATISDYAMREAAMRIPSNTEIRA